MTEKTSQKVLPIDTWIVIATLLPPIDALALERVRDGSTCTTISFLTVFFRWQVDKKRNSILRQRHVWLNILRNMSVDCAPCFPLCLPVMDLLAEELRIISIRADVSYRAWTFGDNIRHTHEQTTTMGTLFLAPVYLKPVGDRRHVIVYLNEVGMACINSRTGSYIWTQPPALFYDHHPKTNIHFAGHLVSDSSMLVLVCTSNSHYKTCEYFV